LPERSLCRAFLLPSVALAECGSGKVVVLGSASEREEVCRALRDVTAYFAGMGIDIAPEFSITFSEQVFVDFYDPHRSQAPVRVQVTGYFDSARRAIGMTSATSESMGHRKPWGLVWSPDIANSILRHEMTHMALHQAMGLQFGRTSKAWIEFISYAVQIELMSEALRNRVLANYPDAAAFESPERVNQLIYGYDPDAFGVRAFLYARDKGGAKFIGRLMRGETDFDLGEIFWMK
jgi:hypothetical protein